MFRARESKPCSHCSRVIEMGTAGGFTWDRTQKGCLIHLQCLADRRRMRQLVTMPALDPHPLGVHAVFDTTAFSAASPAAASPATNGNGNGHSDDNAAVFVKALQSLFGTPTLNEAEIRRIAADEASKVSSNRSINAYDHLLSAAKMVIACWEHGDLAGSVNSLANAVAKAKGIAK